MSHDAREADYPMIRQSERVEVDDGDRQSAGDYVRLLLASGLPGGDSAFLFRGGQRDYHPLTQAFAQRRLKSLATLSPMGLLEEVREALSKARPFVAWFSNGNQSDALEAIDATLAKLPKLTGEGM